MTEPAAPVASEAPAPEAAPVVEAPAVEVEAAPAVDPTPAPEKSDSQEMRKGAAKDRLMARLEAGREAREQSRVPKGTTEGGQFTKEEEEAAAAAPPVEASPAVGEVPAPQVDPASGTPVVEATPEPANAPAEGYVRVPLPAGHPARDRGREFFEVPADQEMDLRGSLNSHTRRSQVEATDQQLVETSAQLAESRADAEYWKAQANAGGVLSADQTQRYNDILQTYGEADAEAYRAGIAGAAGTEDLEARRAEARQAHSLTVAQNAAQQFATSALDDAMAGNPATGVPPQYPNWSEGEVRQALSGYGSICDARNTPPTPSGWYTYANAVYASHPTVVAARATEQATRATEVAATAKALATKEAGEKEAAAMKDAATRHATLPGAVPSAAATGGIDHGTPDQEADLRKQSPSAQKRARGDRIRDFAARAR